MLHQAAIGLGVRLRFLADAADDAAVQVAPDWEVGSAMSDVDLRRFAATCGVVTFEHEVVDLEGLEDIERGGAVLRPSPATLRLVADKLGMRRGVEWAGLPVPPWRQVKTVEQAAEAAELWPELVLKPARGGYDGRGVFITAGPEEARATAERLLTRRVPLLVEPRLSLQRELAVIVARSPSGAEVVYDPVTTVQVDGQCRQVTAPAGLPDHLDRRVRELASKAASALDVVGLMAMELFEVDDQLLVNELAVRPHNTGHHTIDAAVTSQFENHIRAVLDLPLGDPGLLAPAAAMVNVIAGPDCSDPRHRLAAGLAADPGARIHLYGKQPRADRKIGHVIVCSHDATDAARRAWAVVEALGGAVPEGAA